MEEDIRREGFAVKRKHKILPRVLISLLGIALILFGLSHIILGFAGKSTSAVITSIRREGGERAEVIPGRYTYNIGYTFTLPDGTLIDGFTKKISNAGYIKPDGKSTTRIRYLPDFPYINALEQDVGFNAGQVVLIFVGGFLIFAMNSKKWNTHDS